MKAKGNEPMFLHYEDSVLSSSNNCPYYKWGILKENICTLVHLKFKMTIKNEPDSKPVKKNQIHVVP